MCTRPDFSQRGRGSLGNKLPHTRPVHRAQSIMSVGKALSKAEERDLARKEKEREEAFEAWLSKKQEQEKVW